VKGAANAGNLQQLGKRELRFGQVLLRHLSQAFLAEQSRMYRGGQRAERLVGANVLGGFLAADVLFTCRKCEYESTLALGIRRLARESPGHLPHELVP